jgi:hypothetical protein
MLHYKLILFDVILHSFPETNRYFLTNRLFFSKNNHLRDFSKTDDANRFPTQKIGEFGYSAFITFLTFDSKQTHTYTNFFFHMTLPSVEGIKIDIDIFHFIPFNLLRWRFMFFSFHIHFLTQVRRFRTIDIDILLFLYETLFNSQALRLWYSLLDIFLSR